MTDEPIDERGPYTCCRCTEPTWNDDDWCDACVAQAAKENESPALAKPVEGEVCICTTRGDGAEGCGLCNETGVRKFVPPIVSLFQHSTEDEQWMVEAFGLAEFEKLSTEGHAALADDLMRDADNADARGEPGTGSRIRGAANFIKTAVSLRSKCRRATQPQSNGE